MLVVKMEKEKEKIQLDHHLQTVIADAKEEENPFFKRLPDELILTHIISRISEAKSLCFISLVSKHFYGLIFQAQIISIKIPLLNLPKLQTSSSFPGKLKSFMTTPLKYFHGLFQSHHPLPPPTAFDFKFMHHLTTKFLKKFTYLKTLYIEVDYSRLNLKEREELEQAAVVKHNISDNTSVFLLAKFLVDTINGVHFEPPYNIDDFPFKLSNCHLILAMHRNSIVETLIVPLLSESLKNILVTDSKNLSKTVLREKHIEEMREKAKTNTKIDGEIKLSTWIKPAVLLLKPLPGGGGGGAFIMMPVFLFIVKETKNEKDDFLIVKEAFDGEEKDGFFEAAIHVLKKASPHEEILHGNFLNTPIRFHF